MYTGGAFHTLHHIEIPLFVKPTLCTLEALTFQFLHVCKHGPSPLLMFVFVTAVLVYDVYWM